MVTFERRFRDSDGLSIKKRIKKTSRPIRIMSDEYREVNNIKLLFIFQHNFVSVSYGSLDCSIVVDKTLHVFVELTHMHTHIQHTIRVI